MTVNYDDLATEWIDGYFFDGPDFFDLDEYVDNELFDESINTKRLYEAIHAHIGDIHMQWRERDS